MLDAPSEAKEPLVAEAWLACIGGMLQALSTGKRTRTAILKSMTMGMKEACPHAHASTRLSHQVEEVRVSILALFVVP